MESSVFLDANGWVALLNSIDDRHVEADFVWRGLVASGRRFVLTDWIVAEVGNGLARARQKSHLVEALALFVNSERGTLVMVDKTLLDRALEFYGRHDDKSWGLVDCASFLVMRDLGVTDSFTSDRHFAQAGFHCLLST